MRQILFISALLIGGLASCKKCEPTPDTCIDESKKGKTPCVQDVYDPVCGCNNITYINACEAEYAGVISYKPGACGEREK